MTLAHPTNTGRALWKRGYSRIRAQRRSAIRVFAMARPQRPQPSKKARFQQGDTPPGILDTERRDEILQPAGPRQRASAKDPQSTRQLGRADQLVVHHTVTVDGQAIQYTVDRHSCSSRSRRREHEGVSKAARSRRPFFFVACRDGSRWPAGPCSPLGQRRPRLSSVCPSLGVLGPRRVRQLADDGRRLPPPYRLVENAHLLDVLDLVFIDRSTRVSAGRRRGEKAEVPQLADIRSVGDFIRLYTRATAGGRRHSSSASYGIAGHWPATRERHGCTQTASCSSRRILDFGTAEFHPGNDYHRTSCSWAPAGNRVFALAPELLVDLRATLWRHEPSALDDPRWRCRGLPARRPRRHHHARDHDQAQPGHPHEPDGNLRIEIMQFTEELPARPAAHGGPAGQPLHRPRPRQRRRAFRA